MQGPLRTRRAGCTLAYGRARGRRRTAKRAEAARGGRRREQAVPQVPRLARWSPGSSGAAQALPTSLGFRPLVLSVPQTFGFLCKPRGTNVLRLFWKAQASVAGRHQKELALGVMDTLSVFKAVLGKNDTDVFEDICK